MVRFMRRVFQRCRREVQIYQFWMTIYPWTGAGWEFWQVVENLRLGGALFCFFLRHGGGNVNETTKKVRSYGCMEIACQINLNIWKAGSKHPPERSLLLILKWNYCVCYFTTALRKSNCPFPIIVTSESEGGCYTWKAISPLALNLEKVLLKCTSSFTFTHLPRL